MSSLSLMSKNLEKAQESKKIYDSLYGFISLSPFEFKAVKHPFFERLRFIHQLGAALWIYPGARTSRYEHSLGVCAIATRIYDQIVSQAAGLLASLGLTNEDILYWRSVLRLAALYHDIGHLPFSHVGELAFTKEYAKGAKIHEDLGEDLLKSPHFDALFMSAEFGVKRAGFREDVIDAAFGRALQKEPLNSNLSEELTNRLMWKKVICQIITSDFFGADRIDYLLRDTHATGLSCQFDYEQLIDKLTLFQHPSGKLTLGVMLSGLESVEGLIVSRYFVHRRLYYHEAVRACSMHLANIMREEFTGSLSNLEAFLDFSDVEVLSFIRGFKGKNPHIEALKAPYDKRFVALEVELKDLGNPPEGLKAPNIQNLLDLELKALQEKTGIPSSRIDWNYATRLTLEATIKPEDDLQVKMPSGDIQASSQISLLLADRLKGLLGIKYWIFVDSEYLEAVKSWKPHLFRFVHTDRCANSST